MLKDFLKNYPFGPLTEKQTEAVEFIVKKMEVSTIQCQKHQAYVLATIYLETGQTYEPVIEGFYLGGNRVRKLFNYYKEHNPKAIRTIFPEGPNGVNYLGRGLVQITHLYNYETFSKLLRVDLVHNPDLASDPEIAWQITEFGMMRGLFTGKKLLDYLNEEESNWYDSRKIINGHDRAIEIKEYAEKIYHSISGIEPEDIPKPRGIGKPPKSTSPSG